MKRKGGSDTESLTEKLLEELNCKTVFTIPVFGDQVPQLMNVYSLRGGTLTELMSTEYAEFVTARSAT